MGCQALRPVTLGLSRVFPGCNNAERSLRRSRRSALPPPHPPAIKLACQGHQKHNLVPPISPKPLVIEWSVAARHEHKGLVALQASRAGRAVRVGAHILVPADFTQASLPRLPPTPAHSRAYRVVLDGVGLAGAGPALIVGAGVALWEVGRKLRQPLPPVLQHSKQLAPCRHCKHSY